MGMVQVAQIIGKPDLAPAAWVKRLVKMCDQSPATPYAVVNIILEKDLGRSVDDLFERLDVEILGSASIAQVFLVVHSVCVKGHIQLCLHFFQETGAWNWF